MIYWQIIRLPTILTTSRSVEQHLPRKRYVLYPDGHFNCFNLTETQACRHDSSSLMDITYNTNYFKGFDPYLLPRYHMVRPQTQRLDSPQNF